MYKYVAILLFAGVVAMATAEDAAPAYDMGDCDELTAIKVQSQWARAYSHGHNREHFAEAVWRTAFNLSPSLKEHLHTTGSDDLSSGKFREFALRTLAVIEMSVVFLSDPEALKAELTLLHNLQEEKHIPDGFIDSFMKALGHVIPAQLGRCYDRDAWRACGKVIAQGIKGHK